MQALIFHGTCDKEEYYSSKYPSASNSHWLPWLQKHLLANNIHTHTPEVLDSWNPSFDKYADEINRFTVDEETILVGHSCGAGFLVRWLSETKTKVKLLVLVAPWLDPQREKTDDFFDFEIDVKDKAEKIIIIYSTDDDKDILDSVKLIKEKALTKDLVFKQHGHFTQDDMKSVEFPELLKTILDNIH
ncbi:MAG TPA: alpha/beta hydrolase [Acidobacteriota bacterium]|nr:alpha/beta hydrolase [Acidobacteriota bacterium]